MEPVDDGAQAARNSRIFRAAEAAIVGASPVARHSWWARDARWMFEEWPDGSTARQMQLLNTAGLRLYVRSITATRIPQILSWLSHKPTNG